MESEKSSITQIDNMFRKMRSQINSRDLKHYDYTNASYERRKKATQKYLKIAEDVLSDVHKKDRIAEKFIISNSLIMCGGYNYIDNLHNLSLAAAIWILDQLSLQHSLDQIYEYIAFEKDDENELYVPPVCHPAYDFDLIRAVVFLIVHRNDGIVKQGGENGSLVSEASSEKKSNPPDACKYRKAFNYVMELIDKNTIEAVVNRYEQKVWEFYRLAFEATQLIHDKQDRLYAEADKTRDMIGKNINVKNPLLIKPAISTLPDLGRFDAVFSRNNEIASPVEKLRLQEDAAMRFNKKTGAIYTSLSLVNDREKTTRSFADVLPSKLAEKLCTFSVEDPFETAFAILYLLDKDSDIPWLYYGSISVAYTANDQLPYDAMPAKIDITDMLNTLNDVLYRHKYPGYRWPQFTDSEGQPEKREFGKNLSQLLYAYSRSLFPRVTRCKPQLESFLAELGIENENEQNAYAIMLYSMNMALFPRESLALYRENGEDDEVVINEPSIPVETDISREEFIRQKQEIYALRKLLHDETSRRRNTERQFKALADEKEVIRRELADLRELVFNQENNLESDEVVNETIRYPFRTKKRIMAFGGHQAWLKAIRPLLPDVRFAQPDTQPNADLIRNADVIWIQANCLSHPAFYIIIDIVRGYNKQIRYFRWSSAEKCAEQLVKSEEA